MWEGILAAPVIGPRQHAVDGLGAEQAVEVHELVVGAHESTLRARAVVAHDVDEERVVELAHFVDRIDEAADLVIGVLGEGGEGLHLNGEQTLFFVG